MKYVMCNIHIKDYYFKYFVYNFSNFIMLYCDFTFNLLYDHRSEYRISKVSKSVSIHMSEYIGKNTYFYLWKWGLISPPTDPRKTPAYG